MDERDITGDQIESNPLYTTAEGIGLNRLCHFCASILTTKWHRLSRPFWGRRMCSRRHSESPADTFSASAGPQDFLSRSEHLSKYFRSGAFFYESDDTGLLSQGLFTDPAFHLNLLDLRQSAREGCHFCSLQWSSLLAEWKRKDEMPTEDVPAEVLQAVYLLPMIWDVSRDANPNVVEAHNNYVLWFFLFEQRDVSKPLATILHFAMCSVDELKGTGFRPIEAVHPPGGIREGTVKAIKSWFSLCRDSHSECAPSKNSAQETYRPPRLLSVQPPGRAGPVFSLVDTREWTQSVRYATLSHCWGGLAIECLKRAGYEDFLNGHALFAESLPSTFLEAAIVCQALDIDYIWIDALCIIQDDESDWLFHAAEMANVYAHGWVNIAATYASNSHGGLLGQCTNLLSVNGLCTDIRWKGDCKLYGRYVVQRSQFWAAFEQVDAPLYDRGWVFQESILTPRTIQLAFEQIRWHCQHTSCCETWPGTHSVPSGTRGSYDYFVRGVWMEVVDHYRKLKLSHSTDILAAIAGVAAAFGRRHGYQESQYIAGLWLPDLAQQLLWQNIDGHHRSDGHVPSWTWASLLDKNMKKGVHYAPDITCARTERVHLNPAYQLVQACSNLSGGNSLTDARGAYLRLRGYIHRISLNDIKYHDKQKSLGFFSRAELGSRVLMLGADPDRDGDADEVHQEVKKAAGSTMEWNKGYAMLDWTLNDSEPEFSAFYIPLLQALRHRRRSWPSGSMWGLIVSRTADQGSYKRVGTLVLWPTPTASAEMVSESLRSLPEWHHGSQLSAEDFLDDCGQGRYEIKLI